MKKLNMMFFFAITIAVISVVDSWAVCTTGEWWLTGTSTINCQNGRDCIERGSTALCSDLYGECNTSLCGIQYKDNYYYTNPQVNSGSALCTNSNGGCYWTTKTQQCIYQTRCNTQREADSLSCLIQGNIWQDGTCKVNHCKAADSTWLSTSIAACTGSNNYAIVNTDSTCEHVGACCPNDSIPSGNTCKWRCDSVLTTCGNRTGELFGGVLPDTSISGQDTTFSYQCYYNCSHSPNPDSSVYLVEGNIVLSGPNDSIPDGIKSQSTFNSVRTTTGGVYVYDYLTPAASEYIDSIAAMKCVEHLWRCVINSKYVYWYDNQEVPAGCTNIVRVK